MINYFVLCQILRDNTNFNMQSVGAVRVLYTVHPFIFFVGECDDHC